MSSFKGSFLRKASILPALLFVVVLGVIAWFLLHKSSKNTNDSTFSKYIESYTSGVISKESAIRIHLANQVEGVHAQNETLPDGIFDISPSVKGKTYWVDARTIEFKPEKNLDPNKAYSVTFALGKVIKVPDHYEKFEFGFQTIKPDYTVTFNGLQTATRTSVDQMKLEGVIRTADAEKADLIEKIISVNYPSDTHISWQHNAYTHTHTFTIDKLKRLSSGDNLLTVNYDGNALNIDRRGGQQYNVPAIGDFKVLDIRAVQEQEQYVLV